MAETCRVGNSLGHGEPRGDDDDDNGTTVIFAFASTINANLIMTTTIIL